MEGGRLGACTKESSGAFLSGREGALSAQSCCIKDSRDRRTRSKKRNTIKITKGAFFLRIQPV
jgi:hypothetical protein